MMKSHLWDSGAIYTADTLRENGGGGAKWGAHEVRN
jgi:hypothetical protein